MDLARTLVHEIGHLLNDRSLAWSLSTWLEEGIATDLGSVWVESSPEPYAYAHSAAFIRYLLDGEEGRLAQGFRAFLKRIADGLTANLLKFLDRDVEELDRGFQEWLRAEAQASRERLETEAQKLFRRR